MALADIEYINSFEKGIYSKHDYHLLRISVKRRMTTPLTIYIWRPGHKMGVISANQPLLCNGSRLVV